MLTPSQCKAARRLLKWSIERLANEAEMSPATAQRFEVGAVETKPESIVRIAVTLEAAGVEFIAENGGGAGVRLRK